MELDDAKSGHGTTRASNDSQNEASKTRKRVSRACDRCRTKKDKCDGQRPSCSACVAAGLACLYDPSTKKRGLPEGYVRGLEKLWALSIGKVDGLEDVVSQLMVRYQQELLDLWNHDAIGEDLHTSWKESKILHELEGLLSKLESIDSSTLKRKRENEDVGSEEADEDSSFHRQAEYHIAGGSESGPANGSSSPILERTGFVLPPREPLFNSAHHSKMLPGRASLLLDFYFSHTHCWFPIVERHHILRTSYSYSKTHKGQSQVSSADMAALWAILAYSDQQFAKVLIMEDVRTGGPTAKMTAEEMRLTARELIPTEKGPFEIGHIQALLLLTLLDIGLGDWNGAWLLVGYALRVALELDLGISSSQKRGANVLHGCFILDTLIAAHLIKCPHLRRQDLEAFGYLEEDGLEEWDPWVNSISSSSGHRDPAPAFSLSCFNRLLDVFMVLNDNICDRRTGLDKQIYFQERSEILKALSANFPVPLSALSEGPPHHIYLHLFHLSTTILVLRQSFEGGAPSDTLAHLACETLILLTQFSQTGGLGLGILPPILENAVRSASYAAIAARPSFDLEPGLPSYNSFARKMTGHISELSSIWPVFSSLSTLWQNELRTGIVYDEPKGTTESNHLTTPMSASWNNQASAGLTTPTIPNSITAPIHNRTPSVQDMANVFSPLLVTRSVEDVRSWSVPHANQNPLTSPSPRVNSGVQGTLTGYGGAEMGFEQVGGQLRGEGANHPQIVALEPFDLSMSGLETATMPAGLAMPANDPSPSSFHGDDVDVIFHNLAHLDTTEWTNDREQGLKEFGFTDEMTFQAFCNDPERLVPSRPSDEAAGVPNFWPPPGFFPGHFEESDPQLEASQILQSLSGNDPYPSIPGSVGW